MYEVDTYGAVEGGGESVIGVAHEKAGFANTGVAYNDEFKETIAG